jgi:thiol-disulfide isomerase/thioredoxin
MLCAVVTAAVLLAGCGGGENQDSQSKYRPVDGDNASAAINASTQNTGNTGNSDLGPQRTYGSPSQPPALAANQLSDYTPPAGDVQVLFAHLQKLTQQPPRGASPEEQRADFAALQRARVATADKILAAATDANSRQPAIEHKLHALQGLRSTGDADAAAQLNQLSASLAASSDPELALLGKMVQFGQQFDAFAQSESKDASLIVLQLQALLSDGHRNAHVFDVAYDTAQQLGAMGFKAEMIATLKTLANAYIAHPDPQLSAEAADLGRQMQVVEYGSRHGLDTALMALAEKKPGAEKEVAAAVHRMLAAEEKNEVLMEIGQHIARELSAGGFKNDSNQLIKTVATVFHGHPNAELAASAEHILSSVKILEMGLEPAMKKLQDKDPAAATELVALMQQILAAGLDQNVVLDVGQAVATGLGETDHPAEKVQVLRMLGQAFQGSADERVAYAAGELQTQARIIEHGLDDSVKKLLLGEAGASAKVVAAVETILRTEQPGESVLASIGQAAQHLEYANDFAAETQVLNMIEAVYANHKEADFAAKAKEFVGNARLRIAMVGQPISVAVETLAGQPIDWKAYRGKVVLVDFWATWCNPCIAEIPNVKRNYEAYKARGFDVVGISVDQSRGELEAFLAVNNNNMPWTLAVAARQEGVNPIDAPVELMKQWGIATLPFTLLVNREGVVERLHIRGSDLDKQLEQIFGPPSSSPIGALSPATSPAATDGAALDRHDALRELGSGREYFTVFVADEPAEDEKDAEEEGAEEADAPINPYLAPAHFSDLQLVEFLLDMVDRPRVIQERPGFNDAVIDASDRLLAKDTKPNYKRLAVLSKLRALHRMASAGDEKADARLVEYVASLKDNTDEKVALELGFLNLEREALECEKLDVEEIPDLLARLKTYFEHEKRLEAQHLRIASATVKAINRLENDDEREKHFAEFGKLFAASKDQQLSYYGQKLAIPVAEAATELVGKDLELTGLTSLGAEFNWKAYRGKVVIVDFWATWCGPCIREMPNVKEFHAANKDKGFDVVGVSIDKDQEALAKFLEENDVPWETLAGEETQKLAAKYGVKAIPTMMLVDREGKIVAVSHQIAQLKAKAVELLAKPAE